MSAAERTGDGAGDAVDAAPGSFAEVYELFYPRIHSYLVRQLEGRTQEAEDLTADVFTRVYQKLGSYEPRGVPFSAWLFRIAHNQLVDHLRKSARGVQVPIDEAADVREPTSLRQFNQGLTELQLEGALGALSREQRQVVQLRFLRDLSLSETAAELGKTEDSVKKLQARGLASLRRNLDCLSGCWRAIAS